jgi:hypothetical protein
VIGCVCPTDRMVRAKALRDERRKDSALRRRLPFNPDFAVFRTVRIEREFATS